MIYKYLPNNNLPLAHASLVGQAVTVAIILVEIDSRVKRTPCSNDANTTHEVQKYVEVLLLALLYWMQ